jgi:hypothetical protein
MRLKTSIKFIMLFILYIAAQVLMAGLELIFQKEMRQFKKQQSLKIDL